jgi:hypothetical protein
VLGLVVAESVALMLRELWAWLVYWYGVDDWRSER